MISARYIVIFFLAMSVLAILALLKYPGQAYIYIFFTIISNVLLYFGVRNKAIFFDTFIGAFFWLGFWLKSSFMFAFMEGVFPEGVGNFTGSGAEFDTALLIVSCGFIGLLIVSYLRGKYLYHYENKNVNIESGGLFIFYKNNRLYALVGFAVLFLTVGLTNYYYGFYQRGSIPRTILPYGLSGVYKWLLLFGLASFSALIIRFEITLKNKITSTSIALTIGETFISNVSLLSRGMILNLGALLYGAMYAARFYKIKVSKFFYITVVISAVILFLSSVFVVNQLRINKWVDSSSKIHNEKKKNADVNVGRLTKMTSQLFINRWVGMEGVLAISTNERKGWGIWNEAWKEKFSFNKTSFYDKNVLASSSPYKNADYTQHHFISLSGILAFFFYPGSYIFLFFGMMFLGAIAASLEYMAFRLSNKNIILCALLSQVIAYRYAHFGYVPAQSYLLFGSLFLNILIIYFADRALTFWYKIKTVKI